MRDESVPDLGPWLVVLPTSLVPDGSGFGPSVEFPVSVVVYGKWGPWGRARLVEHPDLDSRDWVAYQLSVPMAAGEGDPVGKWRGDGIVGMVLEQIILCDVGNVAELRRVLAAVDASGN